MKKLKHLIDGMLAGMTASRCDEALRALAYLALWIALYAFPGMLGLDVLSHRWAYIELASVALMLVLLRHDEKSGPAPARPPKLKPRAVLLLIGLAALTFVTSRIVCLAHVPYHGEYSLPFSALVDKAFWRGLVTAPLMEEIGCRRIAFGKLRRPLGFWPAALLSVALFCLIHEDVSVLLAVSVIPDALLCCLIHECTGEIRYCVAWHMVHNLLCACVRPWYPTALWASFHGVPLSIGIPALVAVTILMIAVCGRMDSLFVRET